MDEKNLENIYLLFSRVIKLRLCKMRDMFEDLGIYPGQHGLLFALEKEEGQSQKELAQKLNIKPATITVTINRMKKSGLVERKQDKNDQRVSRVYLTNQGKAVCKKVRKAMKTIDEQCFENFSKEQQNILIELLSQMEENLASSCNTEECFFNNYKKNKISEE
ncbi:MarR family winged helix-turn-helix transcriptional regulator [Clostridium grantii]|uniref:DNA-binding transcriptional regulator, MarR family n=1 Tax=Clostridium grantii DSM 8605 TaxID=1121316 RepID=A0A1M5W4R2_9CLOT|nr:MarR family transcriptional regulator [Clostridium grantii]SHH82450.1 DNA-binding transcriptional regulator, MarR family [Clostridium grantii DSM 8605]